MIFRHYFDRINNIGLDLFHVDDNKLSPSSSRNAIVSYRSLLLDEIQAFTLGNKLLASRSLDRS